MNGAFRSLANPNYRVWAAGALVSNIGTWMQRTAQDWLVLTELTAHNATAVGIVTALQFAPQFFLLPWTGYAADRFERRKLLMLTQAALGLLGLGLGLLALAGLARLWHVYAFALALGCVAAFDAPVRQVFVSELVGEEELPNAVGLNSASFNLARLIGPAVAGLLIGVLGTGGVFLLNALSYVAVLGALALLRTHAPPPRERPASSNLAEGFRYVWERPDLRAALLMLVVIGTFGLNFPVYISTMAVRTFHVGAGQFGLLTSIMAIGSVTGALLSARRGLPNFTVLLAGATLFGVGCVLAALMPTYALFGLALVLVGVSAQTLTTSTNSLVQLATVPEMRGRVVALLLAAIMGGAPVGAPFTGWVADHYGPRWALGVGAAAGFTAALIALLYLWRARPARR